MTNTDYYAIIRFMIKESLLEQSGLNQSEVKIYKRLLEYGELTPPRLSELTGLARQNTYAALKTLVGKDLIEDITNKKTLRYRLLHPNKLKDLIDKQINDKVTIQKSLQASLPELSSQYFLSSNKPGITYFEGLDGIRKIFEDILKSKPDEVQIFRSVFDEIRLDKYLPVYVERQKNAIKLTRIISPSVVTPERLQEDKRLNRLRKYIPEELFKINTQIEIYNDNVAFMTYGKRPMGFVISSKDVAASLKTVFELVWQSDFKPK